MQTQNRFDFQVNRQVGRALGHTRIDSKSFIDLGKAKTFSEVETIVNPFSVEEVELRLPNGLVVPDKKAIQRVDTGEYIGTVGAGYKTIQPSEFYSLAEEFVRQTGAVYDKAIILKGGRIIGCTFDLGNFEAIKGDPINQTFVMMTSFDMSICIVGRAISNRFFCTNQLAMANHLFAIKHTRWADERLKVAMQMLGYYSKGQKDFQGKMKALADYSMSDTKALEWFTGLFPKPKEDSKRGNTILENTTSKFVELLNSGMGTQVPGVRGTAYGALQALTEYVNHHRPTRIHEGRDEEEVKFETLTMGSGHTLMQKGLDNIIEMVKSEHSEKLFVQA